MSLPAIRVTLRAAAALSAAALVIGATGSAAQASPGDADDDGISDVREGLLASDPDLADTDGDGSSDGEEQAAGTDLLDAADTPDHLVDSDEDGLSDASEASAVYELHGHHPTDPDNADTDEDALTDGGEELDEHSDPTDSDTDDDGLEDWYEVAEHGTDPNLADTDGDGRSDYDEIYTFHSHPLDPTNTTPLDPDDLDSDGLTNSEEEALGTDPNNADTDGGGAGDGWEQHSGFGTSPLDPTDDFYIMDEDGDRLDGYFETAITNTDRHDSDTDGDGLEDGHEFWDLQTDPAKADTDGDGLDDKAEIDNGSDPLDADDPTPQVHHGDTDHDGLTDKQEHHVGTDPTRADTDSDGLKDGREVHGVRLDMFVKLSRHTSTTIRTVRTDPLVADTDRDRLEDGAEVKGTKVRVAGRTVVLRSSPRAKDTDRDGLRDRSEVTGSRNASFGSEATNPRRWNSDLDGHSSDLREVRWGSDPNDRRSTPQHPHAR